MPPKLCTLYCLLEWPRFDDLYGFFLFYRSALCERTRASCNDIQRRQHVNIDKYAVGKVTRSYFIYLNDEN